MNMNPEVRDLWADALESGEFRQGNGKLTVVVDDVPRHCCLGVLCELAARRGVVSRATRNGRVSYDGAVNYLPEVVVRWAGLWETNPGPLNVDGVSSDRRLSHMNDEGSTFAAIARVIREQM